MLLCELPELLVVIEHADAVHETRAAFAFHDALHVVPLDRRAEHAQHPVDLGIALDVGALESKIVNVRREILLADVMKMTAFLDKHLCAAGVNTRRTVGADGRAADELLNERCFRSGFNDDEGARETGSMLAAEFVNHLER